MTPPITSLLALLLATPVCAHPDEKKGKQGHDRAQEIFERLDTDRDGTITFAEFEANPRLERANQEQRLKIFQRIDKNDDGIIDSHEICPDKDRGERSSWLQKGPITFEQFSQQPRVQRLDEDKRRKLFDRLDENKDGKLSKEDAPRRRGDDRNREIDTDKDGKISFPEFQQGSRHKELSEDELEDRFESIDLNGDGFLSREERDIERDKERSKGEKKRKKKEKPAPEHEEPV